MWHSLHLEQAVVAEWVEYRTLTQETGVCFLFGTYNNPVTWSLNQCADLAVRFPLRGVLSLCVALSIEGKLEGWTLHLKTHITQKTEKTSSFLFLFINKKIWIYSMFWQHFTCFLLGPALEKSPKEKNSGCWESGRIKAFTSTSMLMD